MTKIGKPSFLWTSLPSEVFPCFLSGTSGNEPDCQCRNVGDMRSISGSKRFPGGGHATCFSIRAWRVPWIEEPGGL